ncbi:MAG: gliding motility-associated C-terminal domain-containing protein [Cytophaga sp.]|uniref:T9SS type B sorting domain-containing protein n=1 Tax=Cytophaga sp. TaxID=29535 RepID=UPI003F81221A
MRPDLERYYLIDQYLEKKLQGEQLRAFEDQMKSDPGFAEQVFEQQALNDLILEAELSDVRAQLERDLASLNKPSFFKTYWKWIGLGSLFVAGTLIYTLNQENAATIIIEGKSASKETKTESASLELKSNTISNTVNTSSVKKKIPAIDSKVSNRTAVKNTTEQVQAQQSIELPVQQTSIIDQSVTEVAPTETKGTEEKKHDCNTVKILFTLKAQPTCENEQDGAISIENISGGAVPLTIFINDRKIKDRKITDLNSGTYEIKITDKNGCSHEQKILITEKNCSQPAEQRLTKFNINPTIGEVCKIPSNPSKKANLTIYNRSGKVIYHLSNHSDEYIEWNGTDGYGALVDQGLYVYIIDYSDGTKESGEVNIIR